MSSGKLILKTNFFRFNQEKNKLTFSRNRILMELIFLGKEVKSWESLKPLFRVFEGPFSARRGLG